MHAKFQASRFNNKKKYPNLVHPLKALLSYYWNRTFF